MSRKSTRDAALSRLFGADSDDPSDGVILPTKSTPIEEGEAASIVDTSIVPTGPILDREGEKKGRGKEAGVDVSGGVAPSMLASSDASRGELPRQGSSTTPDIQSGYLGMGRYAREDGIVERITPYVRPDQAEALRVAVARKRDPRGRDISQIIQTLLDEAGYKGELW